MSLRIKNLRKAAGLTQSDLAGMAGLSRSQLSEIETGAKTVNMRRLEAIAKALGVTVPDLMDSQENAEILSLWQALAIEDRAVLLDLARRMAGR